MAACLRSPALSITTIRTLVRATRLAEIQRRLHNGSAGPPISRLRTATTRRARSPKRSIRRGIQRNTVIQIPTIFTKTTGLIPRNRIRHRRRRTRTSRALRSQSSELARLAIECPDKPGDDYVQKSTRGLGWRIAAGIRPDRESCGASTDA